jgi:hypothetical protein
MVMRDEVNLAMNWFQTIVKHSRMQQDNAGARVNSKYLHIRMKWMVYYPAAVTVVLLLLLLLVMLQTMMMMVTMT